MCSGLVSVAFRPRCCGGARCRLPSMMVAVTAQNACQALPGGHGSRIVRPEGIQKGPLYIGCLGRGQIMYSSFFSAPTFSDGQAPSLRARAQNVLPHATGVLGRRAPPLPWPVQGLKRARDWCRHRSKASGGVRNCCCARFKPQSACASVAASDLTPWEGSATVAAAVSRLRRGAAPTCARVLEYGTRADGFTARTLRSGKGLELVRQPLGGMVVNVQPVAVAGLGLRVVAASTRCRTSVTTSCGILWSDLPSVATGRPTRLGPRACLEIQTSRG